MGDLPLILVVGGDALALRVCEELCGTQGHRVALVWPHDHTTALKLERISCEYLPFAPNDYDALRKAGIEEAVTLMALSDDDRVNLQVALKARDINPNVRLVLRQFNRTLARKLEQNLSNCSVLSMASHSAATLAAAAVDPSCFYGLQFPDLDGVLCGFATRYAVEFGVEHMTPAQAQSHLRMRVIALEGNTTIDPAHIFAPDDSIIVFGELKHLSSMSGKTAHVAHERTPLHRRRNFVRRIGRIIRHSDPILRRVIAATLLIFVVATAYFAVALHKDLVTAAYFVGTTMTTTGYGDITPLEAGPLAKLLTVSLMITGLALSGIFIAFVTTALTRAKWTAMQGLRQIHARNHIIVCGSGNVGTRVTEFLRMLGHHVVVIEPNPDSAVIERSRTRAIELLTGDATRDSTLDLCNLTMARAVVALTDSDTANLEVALGSRGRSPHVPVVMRVNDEAFAGSIARQFEAILTFSTSALVAPAFAGLSRFPGTRGRITFGGDDYNVGERMQGEVPQPPPADHCTALAVWRNGVFLHINEFSEMEPYDRLLFIVPLSQFRQPRPHTELPPLETSNA